MWPCSSSCDCHVYMTKMHVVCCKLRLDRNLQHHVHFHHLLLWWCWCNPSSAGCPACNILPHANCSHELDDQPAFLLARLMALPSDKCVHSSCLATTLGLRQAGGGTSPVRKCVAKKRVAAGTGTSLKAAGPDDVGHQPARMANPAF